MTRENVSGQVLQLKGIPPLVALLRSPGAQVRGTASAALRNLSFKNNRSKEEIERCGGIAEAVALLGHTDSAETQKQLTGDFEIETVIINNLSSCNLITLFSSYTANSNLSYFVMALRNKV